MLVFEVPTLFCHIDNADTGREPLLGAVVEQGALIGVGAGVIALGECVGEVDPRGALECAGDCGTAVTGVKIRHFCFLSFLVCVF